MDTITSENNAYIYKTSHPRLSAETVALHIVTGPFQVALWQ
jgi:hypothetical protein